MLPLLWLSIAFAAGILLASLLPLSIWIWLAAAAAQLAAVILFAIQSRRTQTATFHFPHPHFLSFLLLFLCLGAARYQATQVEPTAFDLAWYNDRDYEVLITGTVIEPPDYRDAYTNLRLRAAKIDTGDGEDLPVGGLLLARIDPNEEFAYGDILRVRGKLKTPPENEDFSYRDYLAREGIHAYMTNAEATRLPGRGGNLFAAAIYAVKARALELVYRLFPDPEASLLAGILLGVDSGLPADLQQDFKDTGTAHIIAISGFNIAIISALFINIFSRAFGPRRGAVAAVIGIAFYTLLVGADAAVVRAALMGGLSLFARQVGRRQVALNTLFAVAAVMTLWNPLYVWDAGFQLSFAATLGLILYAEPLSAFATRFLSTLNLQPSTIERVSQPVSDFVLLTLAAQLTTLPIMAYHFNRLSLVSFIANPFILPAQPALMILGGLAVLLGLVLAPLGQLAAWIALPFVTYTIRVVEFFAGLPFASVVVDFPFAAVVVYYAALLSTTLAGDRLKSIWQNLNARVPRLPLWTGLAALLLAALLVWRAALAGPDGRLHVTFLDVGSGDAVLIQTPDGESILVNGGPSLSRLSDQLGRHLSPFDRSLDWLVVASTQEEQVASLPRLVERYRPESVLWAGNVEASFSARSLNETLSGLKIPVALAEPGQRLDLGRGAFLEVLTVGPRGAILLVEWDQFRVVLPIGADFDSLAELEYGQEIGQVSALLLADNGYAPSNPSEWITELRPQAVLLSVDTADLNGRPDAELLETLEGYTLLRTDVNGWVHLSSDGREMWVDVEK
ncbi:MAG: ComEC/Rec2 family competence protein [Chloroflexota bacterium]